MTADQLTAILNAAEAAPVSRLESVIGRLVMDGVRDATRADALTSAMREMIAAASPAE